MPIFVEPPFGDSVRHQGVVGIVGHIRRTRRTEDEGERRDNTRQRHDVNEATATTTKTKKKRARPRGFSQAETEKERPPRRMRQASAW